MCNELTFGNLDTMVDNWSRDLHEFSNIFVNQSEEFKNVFCRAKCNEQKINLITVRLALLNYTNEQLEQQLINASTLAKDSEQTVTKLEQFFPDLNDRSPIDISREHIYETAEKISAYLNNYNNEIDTSTTKTQSLELTKLKDPVEQVAKVMTALLEALENIEMKIEQMKNDINFLNYLTKRMIHEKSNQK